MKKATAAKPTKSCKEETKKDYQQRSPPREQPQEAASRGDSYGRGVLISHMRSQADVQPQDLIIVEVQPNNDVLRSGALSRPIIN